MIPEDASAREKALQQELTTLKGTLAEIEEELLSRKAVTSQLQQDVKTQSALAEERLLKLNELKEQILRERNLAKQEINAGRHYIKDFHGKAMLASKKWESMKNKMQARIADLTELVDLQMGEIDTLNKTIHIYQEELAVHKEKMTQFEGKDEWMEIVSDWSIEKVNLKQQIDDISLVAEERLLIIEEIVKAGASSLEQQDQPEQDSVNLAAHTAGVTSTGDSTTGKHSETPSLFANKVDQSVLDYLRKNRSSCVAPLLKGNLPRPRVEGDPRAAAARGSDDSRAHQKAGTDVTAAEIPIGGRIAAQKPAVAQKPKAGRRSSRRKLREGAASGQVNKMLPIVEEGDEYSSNSGSNSGSDDEGEGEDGAGELRNEADQEEVKNTGYGGFFSFW